MGRPGGKWEIELSTRPRKFAAAGLILGACGFMFYQACWLFLAAWITRDGAPDPAVYERALRYDPDNADYHFSLAQIYNYSAQHLDPEEAEDYYLNAVRLNPRRSAHWLELSKLHEQEGEFESARQSMEKALENDPNYAQTHWSAANLYIRMGDLRSADYEMRRAADLDVTYLPQVLDVAWRFYGDPEFIVDTHVPETRDASVAALNYFVSQDSEVGADLAWDLLRRFETAPSDRLPYVDYLLEKGRPHTASSAFGHGMSPDSSSGVFNGGFESEPLNGGFDWRISSTSNEIARRVSTASRQGLASLRIQFGGGANVNYNRVSHALAVERGRSYELRFWMRTEGVSTDQGVYVEVDRRRSEAPLGTTFWSEYTIPFVASSDLVTIRVRRDPSEKLDDQLTGTVWLDDFTLTDME